jgi:hypothetical protein
MGAFGPSKFYTGYRHGQSVRPEKLHSIELPGVKTNLWTDDSGNTHLTLHDTNVVSFNDRWITLRTGGWKTMMTKARMNWASRNFALGFTVDSRPIKKERARVLMTEGISWKMEEQVLAPDPESPQRRRRSGGERSPGDWFVEFEGAWPFDEETISLNRETHVAVEEDMVKPTDDLYRCKRQRSGFSRNPGRTRSSNIASSDEGSDDIDVEVTDEGSIILFRLATSAARTWWKKNVSQGQEFGGRYVVEHRYAGDIVEGMMADGLNVDAR